MQGLLDALSKHWLNLVLTIVGSIASIVALCITQTVNTRTKLIYDDVLLKARLPHLIAALTRRYKNLDQQLNRGVVSLVGSDLAGAEADLENLRDKLNIKSHSAIHERVAGCLKLVKEQRKKTGVDRRVADLRTLADEISGVVEAARHLRSDRNWSSNNVRQ